MQSATILLVEDNPDDVILIKMALEEAGAAHTTHLVQDGDEAIAYLGGQGRFADRNLYPVPKLVLIDLKLPGKTGHEVLEWMLQQESLKDIVRVVITGSDDSSDLRKSYALGAQSYLRKPITTQQLTEPRVNLQMLIFGGLSCGL